MFVPDDIDINNNPRCDKHQLEQSDMRIGREPKIVYSSWFSPLCISLFEFNKWNDNQNYNKNRHNN